MADLFTLVTGMIPEWLDYMDIVILKVVWWVEGWGLKEGGWSEGQMGKETRGSEGRCVEERNGKKKRSEERE